VSLPPTRARWSRLFAPPGPVALRYALALVGPLALLVVACKVHKLVTLDAGVVGGFAGVGADLAFGAVAVSFVAWLLATLPRAVRTPVAVLLHLLVLALTLLAVLEHGFFLTTGSFLDAELLRYGLAHFDALSKVYASETTGLVWVDAGAAVLLNLLPLAVRRRPPASAAPAPAPSWRARPGRTFAIAVAGLLLGGLLASQAALPGAAEPLRANIFWSFATDPGAPTPAAAVAPAGALPPATDVVLAPRAADAPRRNVVLILLESARWRSTTLADADLPTTPNLARLAPRGAVVDQAWTTVPHTSKALVSLLCGILPRPVQEITEAGPEGVPTSCLPRLLAERGFATAFFQPATAHFERRDQFIQNAGVDHFVSRETLDGAGFEENSYFGWEDDAMLRPILDWVDAQGERPFFLTTLTLASHHKYGVPTHWPRLPLADKKTLDDYLNALAYVDHFVGALVDALEARGRLDDTVIVIVGDHGEGFGEHGRQQHDTVIYEEGLHVPLVLLGPGVPVGAHIGGLRQHIDIAPTVLELLGMPVTSGWPGASLLSSPGHAQLVAWCWYLNRCAALRDGDLKLVHHFGKRPDEVFDLARDPDERRDLVAAGAVTPERVQAWRDALLATQAAVEQSYATQIERFKRELVTTTAPTPSRPLEVRFGEPLRLVGLDIPETRVLQGDPLRVTFHFECLAPLGQRWRIFTHILGRSEGAKRFANADHTPVSGRYPTTAWQPGQFIADVYRYQPQKPLPPGRYAMVMGLWDAEAQGDPTATRALPIAADAPVDAERRVTLFEFEIVAREGSWGFGGHDAPAAPVAPPAPAPPATPVAPE